MPYKSCESCGGEMERRDHRTKGLILILIAAIWCPSLFLFLDGKVSSFLALALFAATFALFTSVGLYFTLKKKRFYYYCEQCKEKATVEA